MDLNSAWVFVRVVQAGSFSAAARYLHMPISTVSAKVAHLEAALGVSLMIRTTRKLQLTEAGSRYFKHAVNACSEIQAAEAATSSEKEAISGLIRLTAPVEMGSTSLTDVISDFLKANPNVQVELLLTDRLVDLVGEGIDVAVRVGEMSDSSLVAKKIGSTELQIYASPTYLKRKGEPKKPQDLATHNCLNFQDSVQGEWELDVGGKGKVRVQVKGTVASNNLISLQRLVLRGTGIALLPRFLCVEDEEKGSLKQILKNCTADYFPVYLVHPHQSFLPRRVRVFMDFVAENLHEFF